MDIQATMSQEDKEFWAALEEELKAEKLAGGEGRIIPRPEYKISKKEWSGEEDGVFHDHQFLYDSDMRNY